MLSVLCVCLREVVLIRVTDVGVPDIVDCRKGVDTALFPRQRTLNCMSEKSALAQPEKQRACVHL